MTASRLSCTALGAGLLSLAGCGEIGLGIPSGGDTPGVDDDTAPTLDDDTTVTDDDTTAAPSDDDSAPAEDDDAAPSDDDAAPTDDDAGPADDDSWPASDDDATPPADDDAGPPDDDTSGGGCTPGTVELFGNGGFETGAAAPWMEFSDLGEGLIYRPPELPIAPASPNYSVWMGGYPNAYDELVQVVHIPASTTRLTISGQLMIYATGPVGTDRVQFVLADPDTGVITSDLGTYSEGAASTDWGTLEGDLPLDDVGSFVAFGILAFTNATDNSSFFLDSLSLVAEVCE